MLFQWTAVSGNQIRLLKRRPLSPVGDLSFIVQIFELESAPPFAAISYVCGAGPSNHPVLVNGRTVAVRKGCLDALWQTHHHNEYERIWVDALCIRQTNLDEKSQQVRLMGQIYSRAECVLVCGGSDGPGMQSLRSALSTIQTKDDLDKDRVLTCSSKCRDWLEGLSQERLEAVEQDLSRLGTLPIWKRLWVLQEIHIGRDANIYVGSTCMQWRAILILIRTLRTQAEESQPDRNSLFKFGSKQSPLSQDWPHSGGFLELVNNKLNRNSQKYTLPESLQVYRFAEHSVPHDGIYARSATIDWPKQLGPILPDYTVTSMDFAVKILRYERARRYQLSAADGDYSDTQFATDLFGSLRIDADPDEVLSKL